MMGMDTPDPPPLPPVKPPSVPDVDETAIARNRRDLDRRRTNRSSLRIEPGISTPGSESGSGLRIY